MSMEVSITNEDGENAVENALIEAGLFNIEAPRPNTEAYRRLMAAAVGYMIEVKKVEKPVIPVSVDNYNSRDDYYKGTPNKKPDSTLSDTIRRQFHDTLAQMLMGKPRKGLPKQEANKLSNFAAYVTGNLDYVDSW